MHPGWREYHALVPPQALAGDGLCIAGARRLFPFTVLDTVIMGRAAHVGLFSTPARHDREVATAALERLHISKLKDNLYSSAASSASSC
jgi:ABC-type cobalamin/Fe3+-siderophores transport system ATPase subunit